MNIPKFYEFFPYILEILDDNQAYPLREIRKKLSFRMNMTEEQLQKLLPSKVQSVFDNRANWACYYLKRAGILKTIKRGVYQITTVGQDYIKQNGFNISLIDLENFEDFVEFKSIDRSSNDVEVEKEEVVDTSTPEDRINLSIARINQQLADDLLESIIEMSPHFFEKLVLDLLHTMGYGGKDADSILHTGYGPDGGIDGLIKEDALGLEHIYVQAKRWNTDSTVGAPEIQKFSGALSGLGARKGIFITTTSFSKQAIAYADIHQSIRIILIDGTDLAKLMLTYGVGLYTEVTYKIQKIDRDYFDEDKQ